MVHAQRRSGLSQRLAGAGMGTLGLVLLAAATGCQNSKPQDRLVVDRGPMYTGAPIFHGTVGSLAQFTNDEPMLVSGYGLIVGLNGTGSPELLPYLAPYMREQARRGGFSPTGAFDINTAVVAVQGLIPPGAARGDVFDLWVESTANSVGSLAGGRLFTTDLQPGAPARDPGKYLGRVGTGAGSVYMDPFDQQDWGKNGVGGVSWQEFQRQGLILGGGRVAESRPLLLTLNQPSYGIAGKIAEAINACFSQGRSDKMPIAVAHDEQHIAVTIPAAFRRDPAAFIEQVRWLYIQRLDPAWAPVQTQLMLAALAEESEARRPAFADHCVQAWKALGRGTLSALRPAYTLAPGSVLESELWPALVRNPNNPKAAARLAAARAGYPVVRDAAVRAGMAMGDPQAVDIMVGAVTQARDVAGRCRLAQLLAAYPDQQSVLAALRLLMADKDSSVRMAAYESYCHCFTYLSDRMGGGDMGAQAAERLMGSFHRSFAYDKDERPRYAVDVVPLGDPLVVLSVSGHPRVVIFGRDAGLVNPTNVLFEGAQTVRPAAVDAAQRAQAVRELAADAGISEAQAQARLAKLDQASAPILIHGRGRLNLRVRDEKISGEMREMLARQLKSQKDISFTEAYRQIPEIREVLGISFYPGDNTKQEIKAVNNLATLAFTLGQYTGAHHALPGLAFTFDKVTRIMHELSKRGAIAAPLEIHMSPLADRMRKAALTARKPDAARPETGIEDLSGVLGPQAKPKTPAKTPAANPKPKDEAPAGDNPFIQ